jgi:hypothetical protein
MESCHRLYGGGLSLVIALGSDLLNSQEQFLVIYLIFGYLSHCTQSFCIFLIF